MLSQQANIPSFEETENTSLSRLKYLFKAGSTSASCYKVEKLLYPKRTKFEAFSKGVFSSRKKNTPKEDSFL